MIVNKTNEMINHEIREKVSHLSDEYKSLTDHNAIGEQKLYKLLEACLEFHYFLVSDSAYQSAFKGMCEFRWHKNTSLTTLIAKAVFGENKQVYSYIKALDLALAKRVGVDGSAGMAQWLKQSGGVSGVTKVRVDGSKAKAERDFRIFVGQNIEIFGLKDKNLAFNCKDLSDHVEHGSQEVAILAKVDTKTGDFNALLLIEEESVMKILWEKRGEGIMTTDAYHRNKDNYLRNLRKTNARYASEVADAMSRITTLKKIAESNIDITKFSEEITV